MVRRCTNPPSARGSGWRRAAGLLTRGSLPRRLPGSATQWRRGGRASPLKAAGPAPEWARGSAKPARAVWGTRHRAPVCDGNLASPPVASLALALALDGVLADTRPLWDAWLEDAARRTRVELDVPADRGEATAGLDEGVRG